MAQQSLLITAQCLLTVQMICLPLKESFWLLRKADISAQTSQKTWKLFIKLDCHVRTYVNYHKAYIHSMWRYKLYRAPVKGIEALLIPSTPYAHIHHFEFRNTYIKYFLLGLQLVETNRVAQVNIQNYIDTSPWLHVYGSPNILRLQNDRDLGRVCVPCMASLWHYRKCGKIRWAKILLIQTNKVFTGKHCTFKICA